MVQSSYSVTVRSGYFSVQAAEAATTNGHSETWHLKPCLTASTLGLILGLAGGKRRWGTVSVAGILLHRHSGKHAECERHSIKALLAQGEGSVPQADHQERQGEDHRCPREAEIDRRD
jgi:hypothetical protein